MKVLLISNLYSPNLIGGAERVVQSLAEGLHERGHQVCVLTSSPTERSRTAIINGVKVYYIGFKNIYPPYYFKPSKLQKFIWHFRDIRQNLIQDEVTKILREENPDIINTHNLAGLSVYIWRVVNDFGAPIIHTLHDYYLVCYKSTRFKNNKVCTGQCIDCNILSQYKRHMSVIPRAVVGVSEYILKKHTSMGFFSKARQISIHNGIKNISDLVANKDVNHPFSYGYIGRISSEKGLEDLISVMNRLNYNLIIAGDGDVEYVNYLKSISLDNIVFRGRMHPEDFFGQINCLIVPSLWEEPLGMVVLEAFRQGVPVIARNVGALSEIVYDKYNGYLFSNQIELEECIINMNTDHYKIIKCNAEKSFENYTLDKFIESYEKIFNEELTIDVKSKGSN